MFRLITILFCLLLVITATSSCSSKEEKVERLLGELHLKMRDTGYGGPNIDRDRKAENKALRKLVEMGSDAVPFLLKKLQDEDYKGRPLIVIILGRIGPEPGVIPGLLKALEDEQDPILGERTAYVLFKLSREPGVLPALVNALSSDNPRTVAGAFVALSAIKNKSHAVPLLVEALDEVGGWTFKRIIDLLGDMGPIASDALPVLRSLAENNDDDNIREKALTAIAKIEGRIDISGVLPSPS